MSFQLTISRAQEKFQEIGEACSDLKRFGEETSLFRKGVQLAGLMATWYAGCRSVGILAKTISAVATGSLLSAALYAAALVFFTDVFRASFNAFQLASKSENFADVGLTQARYDDPNIQPTMKITTSDLVLAHIEKTARITKASTADTILLSRVVSFLDERLGG